MERNYRRKHMVHRTEYDYHRDQNKKIVDEELEMTCNRAESEYNTSHRVNQGDDMTKLSNDIDDIKLRHAAWSAWGDELAATELYLDKKITEKQYVDLMENTSVAVENAIKAGISHKDLPPA